MDLPRSTFKRGANIWYLDDINGNTSLNNDWNPNRIITLREFSGKTVAMGTIAAIHAHGLEIHLLNNMIGYASYNDIYSRDFLTRNGIRDSLSYWHKHKRQFPVGSDVIVRRLGQMDSSSGYLPLTLVPEYVNEGLADELLSVNMLIPAIVKSIESHGLLLEVPIGVEDSWRGFIGFPPQKVKLSVGNLIYAVITQVNLDGRLLKCDWPSSIQPKYTLSDSNINRIRPGTMVSTAVDLNKYKFDSKDSKLPFPVAIKTTILNKFTATLITTHLCKYSLKNDSFILAKHTNSGESANGANGSNSMMARIILVNYDTREIYISMLPTVLMWTATQSETYTLKRSKKFKTCNLIRTYNNYGFHLVIPTYSSKSKWKKSVGFLHSTMKNDKDESIENLNKSKTVYREVYYNYFERWSVLTAKSTDTKYKYMSPQHLPSGTIIRCRIEKILPTGVILRTVKKNSSLVNNSKLGKNSKPVNNSNLVNYTSPFSVWIRLSHLTDIPLATIPKRFKVGKVLRARVLEFDFTKRLIVATSKKSLVNDKNPLTNVYSVKAGQQVTGFVSLNEDKLLNKVAKNVTIKFFSGIRAILSQTDQAKLLQEGVSIRNGTLVTGCVTKVWQDTNKIEIQCK